MVFTKTMLEKFSLFLFKYLSLLPKNKPHILNMKTLSDHSHYNTTSLLHIETQWKFSEENKSRIIFSIYVLNNLPSICFQQLSSHGGAAIAQVLNQLPIKNYISKSITKSNWFTEILLRKKEVQNKL